MGSKTASLSSRWKRVRPQSMPRPRVASSPSLAQIHREGRLLILCARTTISRFVRVEVMDLVGEPLDWEHVWELCRLHGVAPLVYRNLSTICPAAVPARIHELFRRHVQANALLNTLLAKELVTVLDALAAKGVRAIPFKGVTLAQAAYGDLSMRECADLDVIVEQDAVSQGRKVLWSLGYQLTSEDMGAGDESDEPYHFFQKKGGIVAVDLQWVMARRHFGFRLDRSVFWSRLKPVALPSKSVMGLSSEDLLILLCVHGSKHAWEQLKWVCDVAELIQRRPALDWSRVLYQTADWGCHRMVLLGLALAKYLFDITLPLAVLRDIEMDPDIPGLVRRMPKQLLKNPHEGIDEDCADALYVMLKDAPIEQWKLSVALCRAESDVITKPLPWFRFQQRLQWLHAGLKPVFWLASKCMPSQRVRRSVLSWLHRAE